MALKNKKVIKALYYFYRQVSQVVLVVKNPPANEEDRRHLGSILGLGRSSGEGHGNPFQYSCLDNSMDRGAWCATVHRVAKSRIQLKRLSAHTHTSRVVQKYIRE